MCLITFAFQVNPNTPLIVAANRDEFMNRPTAKADFWLENDSILAGRDLEKGGTWIGVTKSGRFAALTNIREKQQVLNPRSRGELTVDFLAGDLSPKGYLQVVKQYADQFNGFNLLVGNATELYWFSNREKEIVQIERGIHSISNASLNTPWPKVTRAKQFLEDNLVKEDPIPFLLDGLKEIDVVADEALPKTGVSLEWERKLSSIFIKGNEYGTRASTIITFRKNTATFIERSFLANGVKDEDRQFQFHIENKS